MTRTVDDVASVRAAPEHVELPARQSIPASSEMQLDNSLRFRSSITLTKFEVFEACEWLESARRVLMSGGHPQEALGLDVLFRELESRVASTREAFTPQVAAMYACGQRPTCAAASYFDSASSAFSGSNSSESELMQ